MPNRLSGLAVAIFGLLLLFVIIPANTEIVDDYGWIRPQTLPDACAVLLIVFGALQAALPSGEIRMRPRETVRALLFAAVAGVALWGMAKFGFLLAAPVLALAVMLLVGERRPGWLAAGAVALPAVIWTAVVVLLERTLP